jgi:CRP/FNR family transcriptional regulator
LDKSGVLDSFSLFRQATTEMRLAVERVGEPLILPPGAFLFRDGDRCEHFTLVGRGSVRVFKTGETGREITLYHVQAGESCLMNTLCVFLGTPARATALVEAPLEALAFPRPVFLEWLQTNDAVRSFIFETMARRLFDVMTLVEEIAFGKMDLRLAHLLCRRFANNGLPLRAISTTHEEIAGELGTAREVVSRLLKEFERLRLLETARGRILLRGEDALRRLQELAENAGE